MRDIRYRSTACAEIVVEGTISPILNIRDGRSLREGSGHYGEARKRPVVNVKCITYRTIPFSGYLTGTAGGINDELKRSSEQ